VEVGCLRLWQGRIASQIQLQETNHNMAFIPSSPARSLFTSMGVQRSERINGLLIENVTAGKLSGQFTCFMGQMFPTDEQWVLTINGHLLTSANFPNLTSMSDCTIDLTHNKIESVTFPELTTVSNDVIMEFGDNDQMSSVSFTKLATIGTGFTLNFDNPILSVVRMPAITAIGANAYINFHGGSLNVDSVNEILISLNRGVGNSSCLVDVGGGTSAAPTGAGLTAKNALVARGWGVTTN